MTAAVFTAAYADFKLIKTRGVVSISFEVPVEQAQAALDVLGGMPIAAAEVWCAIAKLNPGAEAKPTLAPTTKSNASQDSAAHGPNSGFDSRDRGQSSKKAFVDLPLPQQAGMLCADIKFQRYIKEKYGSALTPTDNDAADWVRWYCGVKTRADIKMGTHAADKWHKLESEYRTWLHHPEMA